MAQVCLYMDDALVEELRSDAKQAGASLSRHIVNELRARKLSCGWPSGFFDLYGCLADDESFAEPPDQPFDPDEIPALETR